MKHSISSTKVYNEDVQCNDGSSVPRFFDFSIASDLSNYVGECGSQLSTNKLTEPAHPCWGCCHTPCHNPRTGPGTSTTRFSTCGAAPSFSSRKEKVISIRSYATLRWSHDHVAPLLLHVGTKCRCHSPGAAEPPLRSLCTNCTARWTQHSGKRKADCRRGRLSEEVACCGTRVGACALLCTRASPSTRFADAG